MPDLSGKGDAKFVITLCTVGGGTSTMLVSINDESDQPSQNDHLDGQDCPFGIALSKVTLPGKDALALASVISYRTIVLPRRNDARPPLPALGPPLGSRAPPSNLG